MRYVNCESQWAVIAFKGLLPGTALYENLIRSPPKDMDDIFTRVEGEILLERAKESQEARLTATVTSKEVEGYPTMWNHQNKGSPQDCSPEVWSTIHPITIYKRHKHEEIFKKPPPPTRG